MKVTRRVLMKTLSASAVAMPFSSSFASPSGMRNLAPGPFQPTWDSLKHYQIPEWFRDVKFGIWAHWSPQCVP